MSTASKASAASIDNLARISRFRHEFDDVRGCGLIAVICVEPVLLGREEFVQPDV